MPRIDIRDIEERFESIASEFDIDTNEVRYLFIEALEEYFKSDVVLKSAGVEINGRYKNIRMAEYDKIAELFREKIIRASAYHYKKHLYTLLHIHNHILYAKYDFTGEKKYYLIPYSKNRDRIKNFTLYALKESEFIPRTVTYFPVYVYNKIEKVRINTFRAQCSFMNKPLLQHHAQLLSNKIFEALGIKVSILPIGVNKKDRVIVLSIQERVTKAVTNYIERYFLSFHYKVIFKKV